MASSLPDIVLAGSGSAEVRMRRYTLLAPSLILGSFSGVTVANDHKWNPLDQLPQYVSLLLEMIMQKGVELSD